MNKIKNYWPIIFPIISLMIMILVFTNCDKNVERTQQKLHSVEDMNNALIKSSKETAASLTENSFYKKIKNRSYDIADRKKNLDQNIRQAFDITFNKTKDNSDYQNLPSKLKPLVGDELSSYLVDMSKPTVQPDGKTKTPYGKLTGIQIGYGKQKKTSGTMLVIIIINYDSQKIDTTATGINNQGSEIVNHGSETFNLQYDPKDNQIVSVTKKGGGFVE